MNAYRKIPRAVFLLLLAATHAHAWPFRLHETVGNGFPDQNEHLAFPSDADRMREIFAGATGVMQLGGGFTGSVTTLPSPDKDPYLANDPNVSFRQGRGDVGDLDGDGDLDLVSSCLIHYGNLISGLEPNNIRILSYRNDGNGAWTRLWQFKSVHTGTSNNNRAPSVKLADLDGDGDLDLIETFNSVRIRWNPGNGDFNGTPTSVFSGFITTPTLVTGDFDRNGWQDIAVFYGVQGLVPDLPFFRTGRITLLSNQGGSFTASTLYTHTPGIDFVRSATADLDGDGRTDLLATVEPSGGQFSLLYFRNNGAGFNAPVTLATAAGQFTTGDLNGDGILDIITDTPSGTQWLRGSGGGAFAAMALISPARGTAGLVVADLDGDGDQDIALDGGAKILENSSIHRGAGALALEYAGINPTGTVTLAVGDINHDGKDDLITGDGGGQQIRWYPGTGTASGLGTAVPLSTGGLAPASIAVGDFNRDGWNDLIYTTPSNNTLTYRQNTNGSGFAWNSTAIATMTGINRILAADLESDGDLDILSAASSGTIRWHKNNGSASSWLPENVATGLGTLAAIATAQETPGGRPEVAAIERAGSGNGYLDLFRHNGVSWVATSSPSFAAGGSSTALAFADIQDSTPGMETVHRINSNAMELSHKLLSVPQTVGFGSFSVNQVVPVDWNGDGHMDLLAAASNGVQLYLNPRSTSWNTALVSTVALLSSPAIREVALLNLDADGLPDAVAVESATGKLHMLFNRSGAIRLQVTSQPALRAFPGATLEPFTVEGRNNGYTTVPRDPDAAPADLRFRFLRTAIVNGEEVPGTPLTQSEVDALIANVSLRLNGQTIHSAIPLGVVQGIYNMVLPSSARSQLATAPGTQRRFQAAVTMKSNAASASVQRFFVEYSPASGWVALDSDSNSSPYLLSVTDTTGLTRSLLVVSTPSALEQWRWGYFGTYEATGDAANDADVDGDNVPNLVEYLMNRHPLSANGIAEGTDPVEMTGSGFTTPRIVNLHMLANPDSRVTVTLQQTTNLQFWHTLATRTGGGSWIGRTPTVTQLSGGRAKYSFNPDISPQNEPKYFLRLRVEEAPWTP